jgi:hypothetical protein
MQKFLFSTGTYKFVGALTISNSSLFLTLFNHNLGLQFCITRLEYFSECVKGET